MDVLCPNVSKVLLGAAASTVLVLLSPLGSHVEPLPLALPIDNVNDCKLLAFS
jgi:hypothetical protein